MAFVVSRFALTATDFSFNSERKVGKRTPPLQATPLCKSRKGVPNMPETLSLIPAYKNRKAIRFCFSPASDKPLFCW
ncbi:MAG TPA: hypothetical protein ENJ11_03460 [Gammaproteobacteria bacterium]|nr:hypothetical protein [Gammaproteobacteria bacterium]